MTDAVHHIRGHLAALADAIGERHMERPHALRQTIDYLTLQWRAQGYPVDSQVYTIGGTSCANLEVTRKGSEQPNEIILVGTHYDTPPDSPGANANASALAALLELTRLYSRAAPKRTLRFTAFANGAPPHAGHDTMGSWVYAHEAQQRGDDLRAVIILDSLGYYSNQPNSQLHPPLQRPFYPEQGNYLAFIGDLRATGLTRRFRRAFATQGNFPSRRINLPGFMAGIRHGDALPFQLHGIPTLRVTDTGKYRYPFHHTAKDTLEKVNCLAITHVTIALARAIAELANGN